MKTSEFMDKKVMDPSRSTEKDAAFNFFNPHDDGESDDGFDADAAYGFHLHRTLANDASRPHGSVLRFHREVVENKMQRDFFGMGLRAQGTSFGQFPFGARTLKALEYQLWRINCMFGRKYGEPSQGSFGSLNGMGRVKIPREGKDYVSSQKIMCTGYCICQTC